MYCRKCLKCTIGICECFKVLYVMVKSSVPAKECYNIGFMLHCRLYVTLAPVCYTVTRVTYVDCNTLLPRETVDKLIEEGGSVLEHPLASQLRRHILAGEWDNVSTTPTTVVLSPPLW